MCVCVMCSQDRVNRRTQWTLPRSDGSSKTSYSSRDNKGVERTTVS